MTEKNYALSYIITNASINLAIEIAELVSAVTLKKETTDDSQIRRENQMRSICSSLAIENTSLSLEQVMDVIAGKRGKLAPDDVREIRNMHEAYSLMPALDPFSMTDMLSAHEMLTAGLTKEAGRFRSGREELPAQTAPPAVIVPKLMHDLANWAKTSEAHSLIKSCVFHYEFNFIQPFTDGNGRMGRMWQMLMLSRWKPFFAYLPVEALLRERREEYYDVLAVYENAVDSTAFIEFMLSVIRDVLRELQQTEQVHERISEQVKRLLTVLGKETLSSKELMMRLKLKHRPTFRDNYLLPAISFGLVEMTVPDKPNSSRQRYRATTATRFTLDRKANW